MNQAEGSGIAAEAAPAVAPLPLYCILWIFFHINQLVILH